MKCFALVNPGLENITEKEVKEFLPSSKPKHLSLSVEFEVKKNEDLLLLAQHLQSVKRICISLGKYFSLDNLKLATFPWLDFFTNETSFKVEVENVSGQDNRFAMAKNVAGHIFSELEKVKMVPKMEMKKPNILVIVFYTGKEYLIGIYICGRELNSRHYRVFPHPASFKGDLGYYFVRTSGFKLGEQILIGFAKDGVLAIEAALFQHQVPLKQLKEDSWHYFPSLVKLVESSGVNSSEVIPKVKDLSESENKISIFAFDQSIQNTNASRKNAYLAGVKSHINLQKYSLEDLDVKYDPNQFDRIILQVTSKDEDQLNEIYYQTNYVLKSKGTLLLLGRKGWDFSVSNKFKLLQSGEMVRGNSITAWWLLEKV